MCSCSQDNNHIQKVGNYIDISENDYDLNAKEGSIEKDFVPDAQTAQAIGDTIIQSIVEDEFSKLTDVSVSYDSKNHIWIVTRSLESEKLGGDYSCAIQKTDGKILKVWAGE